MKNWIVVHLVQTRTKSLKNPPYFRNTFQISKISWYLFFLRRVKKILPSYSIPFRLNFVAWIYCYFSFIAANQILSWHLMWHKGRRTWPRSIATEPKLYCTARSISPVNCLDTRKFRRWTRVDRCPLSNRRESIVILRHDEEWKRNEE